MLWGHRQNCRVGMRWYTFILLLFVAGNVVAQTKQVSGTVTDSQGEPLIGVSVLQKETTNGTVTDFDGNFQLSVPQGAILSFSYIGYDTKEVAVGNQSHITVKLEEDTQKLDEVIVVGYGVQKKSVVTGAISSIKSEDMYTSVTNAEQALQGKPPAYR
ncbi:MAG: carboxypeptidase-like regulatory domain-containing protein [Tannerellaceae bacterium]|nr:carboxypeptidase-like regulatory domain-containing protein [Tannerellaceae bacterium]